MARKITDLHQEADLLAIADYNVIPKYMFGTPAHASWYSGFAYYRQGIAQTHNGDLAGKPIILQPPSPAAKYVAMLLGSQGQKVMKSNGFEPTTAYAVYEDATPAALRPLVESWPGRGP